MCNVLLTTFYGDPEETFGVPKETFTTEELLRMYNCEFASHIPPTDLSDKHESETCQNISKISGYVCQKKVECSECDSCSCRRDDYIYNYQMYISKKCVHPLSRICELCGGCRNCFVTIDSNW